jgi:N-acetylglucosaminyl-diphospho-decaprenol L-rhamnosyltransferase
MAPTVSAMPGQTREVSILIVAYNSAALISACLDAIPTAARNCSFEVLLVDNGDGSTETLVARDFPDVRIVPSRGNIGFAAGNNLLASHARAERLLLLNPDMVALPGAIDALMKGAERHPEAAAWGGVTVDPTGRPDAGNAIAMPSLAEFASVALGRSNIGRAPLKGLDHDMPVDVLIGGFVMFARTAWDEAGGLDERYFLYCEEVDLFHRLQQRGHRVWRIADAYGRHEAAHGNHLSPMRLLYRAAGSMEFVRTHWSPGLRVLSALLMWVAAMERYLAGKLLGSRRPQLRQLGDGYRHVALRPRLWMSGYHPARGLMARLADGPIKD